MRGVSANVMCGQEGYYGTNSFQTLLDLQEMNSIQDEVYKRSSKDEQIELGFGNIENPDDTCSKNHLQINNNISSLNITQTGNDTDYNPGF